MGWTNQIWPARCNLAMACQPPHRPKFVQKCTAQNEAAIPLPGQIRPNPATQTSTVVRLSDREGLVLYCPGHKFGIIMAKRVPNVPALGYVYTPGGVRPQVTRLDKKQIPEGLSQQTMTGPTKGLNVTMQIESQKYENQKSLLYFSNAASRLGGTQCPNKWHRCDPHGKEGQI